MNNNEKKINTPQEPIDWQGWIRWTVFSILWFGSANLINENDFIKINIFWSLFLGFIIAVSFFIVIKNLMEKK